VLHSALPLDSMNITLGVPRIKEIINASKKIATPIITAPLQIDNDEKVARIVKGRIEKTLLGDIAEYIEEVFSPTQCYLSIKLDLEAIQALQLGVTVDTVTHALLNSKKLKLKQGVRHKGADMLRITPPDTSKDGLLYSMQNLKVEPPLLCIPCLHFRSSNACPHTQGMLPYVIVSGIPSVNRAVINKIKDKTTNSTVFPTAPLSSSVLC
jgi:DNA-directed RNA polymerase III subunit RPC1